MFRTYLSVIAAVCGLALLATTIPSSVTDAKELTAKKKRQGAIVVLLPEFKAVGKQQEASRKRPALKARRGASNR